MSSALNRWINGLLHQGLALPIIAGATFPPITGSLVAREFWPGNEPLGGAVTIVLALCGYAIAAGLFLVPVLIFLLGVSLFRRRSA